MGKMLKRCKRFSVVAFVITVVFSALTIASACPHYDKYNDIYMVEYDNRGRPHHYIYFHDYYEREIYVDPEKIVDPSFNDQASLLDLNAITEFIYHEKYKFYMYESGDPAVNRFSHIKECKVLDENTKVVPVAHNYYKLSVPVDKIFKEAQEKRSPIEHTVLYNLIAVDVTAKHNKSEYDKAKNAVASSEYNDIGYKYLWVKPFVDYASAMEGVDEKLLDKFPEAITVTVDMSSVSVGDGSALTALSIDDGSYSVSKLGGTYNKADKTFTFKAPNRGIYTVVALDVPTSSSPDTSSVPGTSSNPTVSSEDPVSSNESDDETAGGESSEDVSEGESSEVESETESETESEVESEASSEEDSDSSETSEDEKGKFNVVALIIAISVVVMAGAGGLIFYLMRKKD